MSSSLSWLGMRLSMESDYPNMPLRSSSLMYLLPTIIRAGLPNQMSTRSNPNLHVQTSQPMQYQLQRGRSLQKSEEKVFSRSFQLLAKSIVTVLGVIQKLGYWREEEATWSSLNLWSRPAAQSRQRWGWLRNWGAWGFPTICLQPRQFHDAMAASQGFLKF